MALNITDIIYHTEGAHLSDTNLYFTGNVQTNLDIFPACTIGEKKEARLKYTSTVSTLNNEITYDFCIGTSAYSFNHDRLNSYYIVNDSTKLINTWYDMTLQIGGYFTDPRISQQNNTRVQFRYTDASRMNIEIYHTMWIRKNTYTAIGDLGTTNISKYDSFRKTSLLSSDFDNSLDTSYKGSTAYFIYHSTQHYINATNTIDDTRKVFIPMRSNFWNKNHDNATADMQIVSINYFTPLLVPTTTLNDTDNTIVEFIINHFMGLPPTSSIIRLCKNENYDGTLDWASQLDIEDYVSTITIISPTQVKVSATIPPKPVGEYMIYDVVWAGVPNFVNSHYAIVRSTGVTCIPVVETFYQTAKIANEVCPILAPIERYGARLRIHKDGTNAQILTGFNTCSLSRYGKTFNECFKTLKLEVLKSGVVQYTRYGYQIGFRWAGDFYVLQDSSFINLAVKDLRVNEDWAGQTITHRWTMNFDFDTYTEDVVYENTIQVKAFEVDGVTFDISVLDTNLNPISVICSDVSELVLKICKVPVNADVYNIIAVLYKDNIDVKENDTFTNLLGNVNDTIFYDLGSEFGGTSPCTTYKLNVGSLPIGVDYKIGFISYKQ